jgi:hypothetical protein
MDELHERAVHDSASAERAEPLRGGENVAQRFGRKAGICSAAEAS